MYKYIGFVLIALVGIVTMSCTSQKQADLVIIGCGTRRQDNICWY